MDADGGACILPGAAALCGAAGPLAVGAGMSTLADLFDTRGVASFVRWPAAVHVCLAGSLLVACAWSAQAFRQQASQDVARLPGAVSDLQTPQTSMFHPIAKDTSRPLGTPQEPTSVDAVVDVGSALAAGHGLVIRRPLLNFRQDTFASRDTCRTAACIRSTGRRPGRTRLRSTFVR